MKLFVVLFFNTGCNILRKEKDDIINTFMELGNRGALFLNYVTERFQPFASLYFEPLLTSII